MYNPDVFGPILVWEMMTVSRRARYFWLRVAYALFLLFLLWSTFQSTLARQWVYGPDQSAIAQSAIFASAFFWTFSVAQISAILFLTPAYVSSSIVVERERRTIEYLFASSLTNREIVLGKWSARSLNLLLLILAGIPVLSFASFFGGIGLDRVLLLALLSVAMLLSTSAVSIFVSIHGRSIRSTLSNAYSMIVLWLVAPVLVSAIGETFFHWLIHSNVLPEVNLMGLQVVTYLRDALAYFHPYYTLFDLGSTVSGSAAGFRVFMVLGIHALIAAVFLRVSIVRIRSAYRAQVSTGNVTSVKGKRPWLPSKPVPAMSNNPMLWKEWNFSASRRRNLFASIFRALFVIAGYWIFFLAIYYSMSGQTQLIDYLELNVYVRTVGTIAVALTLAIILSRSATSLSVERDKDTWISLLTTPLTSREIIWAKLVGALKPLTGLFAVLAPAWFLSVFFGALSIAAIPCLFVVIVAYCSFVASLGVYQSLRRKSTGSALAVTSLICALLGGFGHMITSLIALPLMLLGIEWEWLGMLFITSVPWFVLAMTPFPPNEVWANRTGETFNEFVACCVFWVVAYYAAAAMFYFRSVREFGKLAPRAEPAASRQMPTNGAEASGSASNPADVPAGT